MQSEPEKHKCVLIASTDTYDEWECPKCGRHMIFHYDGQGLEIKKKGDMSVRHYGSVGGISLEGMEIDNRSGSGGSSPRTH